MKLQRAKRQHPPEDVVQEHIMGALRSVGMIVLSTVHRLRMATCPHCGHSFRPPAAYGASKGVPDVIARPGPHAKSQWPAGVWAGIEVKGHKTAISTEQKWLKEQGAIVICRNVQDALDAVEDINREL